MTRTFIAAAADLVAAGSAYTAAPAQDKARSIWGGVYTEAQAKRGQAQYESKCASCHGGALTGMDVNPPLAGARFIGNWTGQTVGDLAVRIRTTMPADDPGSLGSSAIADTVAYMLKVNRLPTGATELPPSAAQLRRIRIEARQ